MSRSPEHEEKESLYSRRIFAMSEYELSPDGTLKLFDVKGPLKKRRVLIRKISIYDITNIESFENELSITWNGVTNLFFMRDRLVLLTYLRDKIMRMLEEPRKPLPSNEEPILEETNLPAREPKQGLIENDENVLLRKGELLGVISASMGIVDLSFDILIELKKKQTKWERLEDHFNVSWSNFSFTGKSIPSLKVNYTKISSALKSKNSEETSKEAFNILKVIRSYFDNLSLDDDFKDHVPNFLIAKAIILSYFMLNELLLDKVVGEAENNQKIHQLERYLQILADKSNFKVNMEELKISIDKVIPQNDFEGHIQSSRKIFKDQFLSLAFMEKFKLTGTEIITSELSTSTSELERTLADLENAGNLEVQTDFKLEETETEPEPELEYESREIEPEPETKPNNEPESKNELEPEPEPEPESEYESREIEKESEPEPEPEYEPESKYEPESEYESTEIESESESELESKYEQEP